MEHKLEDRKLDEKELGDVVACGTGVEREDTSGGEIVEPFNPSLIRVETKLLIIDTLLKRMRHGEIDLQPDFQRKAGIWTDNAQSRLIESILVRIPLPAFYMDATDDDHWLVVDGLQRLTALRRFVILKELQLEGLEFLTNFRNKTFDELPRNYQRRIEETQITVYLIEKGTPLNVKFNIFRRINTGGLPLSPQEIRHALNPGPVNAFLKCLAGSEAFGRATTYSVRDDRMGDREFVLRFLAFATIGYDNYTYQDDLDNFLNKAMVKLNEISEAERQDLKSRFFRTMDAAHKIFGRYAFRKQYQENGSRYPINKALFETWSVNLDRLTDEELGRVVDNREEIQRCFIKLMNNDKRFEAAVSVGTGDAKNVRQRFSEIEKLLRELLQ